MELQHHGVKGMRWGVRRFQNPDGSLTSAGERRYSETETGKYKRIKSEHRIRLEDKYRSKGMSDSTAELAANRRIKTEKIIAAVAGMTIAAAATYVAVKEVKYRADSVVKSGSKLQIITNNANKRFDKAFYAAYDKKDRIRYTGKLGANQFGYKNVHRAIISTDGNLKVASPKHAEDAFVKLYKTDPEFRKAFIQSNHEMVSNLRDKLNPKLVSMMDRAGKEMSDRDLRKVGYQAFNVGLVNHTTSGVNASKRFYDYLSKQGYGGVFDVNDQKYSGYNSQKPIVVFNAKGHVSSRERINRGEIEDALKKATNMDLDSIKFKQLAASGGELVSAMAIGGIAMSSRKTSVINRYREEHPNTKLTDDEIYARQSKR